MVQPFKIHEWVGMSPIIFPKSFEFRCCRMLGPRNPGWGYIMPTHCLDLDQLDHLYTAGIMTLPFWIGVMGICTGCTGWYQRKVSVDFLFEPFGPTGALLMCLFSSMKLSRHKMYNGICPINVGGILSCGDRSWCKVMTI